MIDLKKSFKNIFKNILVQFLSFLFLLSGLGIGYAAWTTLTSNQGATGQPVNQTLMQGIINNLNDLNTRVASLGTGKFWSSDGAKDCVPVNGKQALYKTSFVNGKLTTVQTGTKDVFGILGDDGDVVYETNETMKSGTVKSITSGGNKDFYGDTSTSTIVILCVDGKALNILSSSYKTTDGIEAFNAGQAR
ncbi:MAG: hypothetical protein PHI37_02345 [Candidatus Gracilibacteria bacterium]|nr:hypothetical protein [Candidatus Gracilibacteria bacterium]